MAATACRLYRLKVYLNATCRMPGGEPPDPITVEFSLLLQAPCGRYLPLSVLEDAANQVLAPYQRTLLNEQPLFQDCVPSLETIADRLVDDFAQQTRNAGGVLLELTCSITPTKSYILRMDRQMNPAGSLPEEQFLSQTVDAVLDAILDEGNALAPERERRKRGNR